MRSRGSREATMEQVARFFRELPARLFLPVDMDNFRRIVCGGGGARPGEEHEDDCPRVLKESE